MNRNHKQAPTRPFFTRFLEKQELRGVAGGDSVNLTLKFPSDLDEPVADDGNATLKFPSDLDEVAIND